MFTYGPKLGPSVSRSSSPPRSFIDFHRPPSPMTSFGTQRPPADDVAATHQPSPTIPSLDAPLPTDVAALQAIVNTLLAEVKATTSVNTHLAATVARLQASQSASSTPTPATTASSTPTRTSTPTPTTFLPHLPIDNPRTIASGRGCASPELFQKLIKKNWHGRLGRTHMVEVDALPATALSELDCLLRRKLHATFPRGSATIAPDADTIFASLAALGMRLEDRGTFADLPIVDGKTLHDQPTMRRGTNELSWYLSKGKWADYWKGAVLETVVELARYRGLFDDDLFVKTE